MEAEDRLLDRVNNLRMAQRMAQMNAIKLPEGVCTRCGNPGPVSADDNARLVCTPCLHSRWTMPELHEHRTPPSTRGGPFYLQTPKMDKPQVMVTKSKLEAASLWCRMNQRKRVPRGTRIWPV
jgi:ribosomal protein S27AE